MPFNAPFYRWRPHPWHGLEPGPEAPRVVQAYIEITPFDLIKYEVDKITDHAQQVVSAALEDYDEEYGR